jgi:PAS domain S-box-containing protein
VVQDQATHASKDDGKSEGGSPPLARIRTTWRCLNRWHSVIGLRLLASVLLFSSAITLLLTLLQLYFDYRRDVGTIDRQISEIESSYRRSLGEGLWNLDARQLELQLDGILHLPDIRFVEVREATDRADPMVLTAGSHQANADVHREFPIFHMSRGAEQTLGVLSIEATLDDVYRRLFDTAIVILISQGAKTFVVSFFILYIVNQLITRHLVTAAKFLGGYDLRRSPPALRLERRPLRQADELDQLVGAFNGMCASLQTAYGELRGSERRFRDYTEMASDWLWATDREHRFTFFSEHSGAFGYDWGKLIGKPRWEVAADFASDPEKWREHIAILERREPFRDFVYENRRTDGPPGIISVSGKPAFDAEGRFSGYRGVASDLTDRKRAEQALQRSESYLAEAERLSHTGSWAVNLKGERTIVYWSEESYRIYGLDPLQGLPTRDWVWQQVHPDDRSRLYEEIQEAVRQKRDYVVEFRILLPDGTIKHLEAIGHHLFSADGELLEVMGTHIDGTERKRAQDALRESEYKLRQIIETVPGLIWSNGPDGEPTHINQRMLDFSGMRFEDFKLRGWEAFVHSADFPETAEGFYHAIQTGTSYEGRRVSLAPCSL